MLNKIEYRVDLYFKYQNTIIKETRYLSERPNINDYQNYFAPKLSTCYSIQFFRLIYKSESYVMFESWAKSKKNGWKRFV